MDIFYHQNGFSYHPTNRSYNERNYGYGLGLRDTNRDTIKEIAIGKYLNSLNEDSKYLDLGAYKKLNGLMSIGITGGLVTGYPKDPQPYILPALKFGNRDYELNLRYAPKYEDNPETWMLNFGMNLNPPR